MYWRILKKIFGQQMWCINYRFDKNESLWQCSLAIDEHVNGNVFEYIPLFYYYLLGQDWPWCDVIIVYHLQIATINCIYLDKRPELWRNIFQVNLLLTFFSNYESLFDLSQTSCAYVLIVWLVFIWFWSKSEKD